MSIEAEARQLPERQKTTPVLEAIHLHKEFPVGRTFFGTHRAVQAVEDTSLALYPGKPALYIPFHPLTTLLGATQNQLGL